MYKSFVVSLAIIMFVSFVAATAAANQALQCLALFNQEQIVGFRGNSAGAPVLQSDHKLMTLSDRLQQIAKDTKLNQQERDQAELALKVLRLSEGLYQRYGARLDQLPQNHPNTKMIRLLVKMYIDQLQQLSDTFAANRNEIQSALLKNETEIVDMYAEDQPRILQEITSIINTSTIRHSLYAGAQRVGNHTILEIHGHEDPVKRLKAMYIKYAEKNGWTVEILDSDNTGVVLEIQGTHALTYLSLESGKHKVIRQDGSMTHSQEALVQAYRPVETTGIDPITIAREIKFKPILASGAGGQHIQKNETAVLAIHLPTGIQRKVQVERSQEANKKLAISMIYGKIKDLADRQQRAEQIAARSSSADRGSQQRSPFLRVYRLDVNAQVTLKILEGQLDDSLNSHLFRAQVDHIEILIQHLETGNFLK